MILEDFGIDPRRFAIEWVSSAEAPRFAEVVTRFTETVRKLGPNPCMKINSAGQRLWHNQRLSMVFQIKEESISKKSEKQVLSHSLIARISISTIIAANEEIQPMEPVTIGKNKKSTFIDKVKGLLPDGGNLNLCLTCGACASGCPATGLEGMDPRKFLRLAALGIDEEVTTTPWVWMCTMCTRCVYVCPMKINIPQLVFYARQSWPRENRPKGILGSCDMAMRSDTCSAMGASEEDFKFVVEDVLDEYREGQPEFAEMEAPVNKKGG
jgi:ferredoxin